MSTLAQYNTRILIDLLLTTTRRFSTEDIYINSNFYERRLLNEIDVTKQLSDIYWGIIEPETLTLRFSNSDGLFFTLEAGEELRGKGIKFQVYEPLEGTPVSFLMYGKIVDYDLRDEASLTVIIQDPDPLNAIIPRKVYETTDWSESPPNVINPAYDLGKAYNICFGYCKKVPLRYIHADYTNNYFDYIICYGTIESNNSNKATTVNVYRSRILVSSSEYTVYDGSQGSPYPGYAFIRFIKEQIDFSGSPYELTADIRGLKLGGDTSATRNFVRVIQHLLSNSTYGLGLTIDTTSFDTAAGQMTDLLCDGFISEQKRCSDILNELLFCCRGGISYNDSGAITIKCDVYDSAINYNFGHKDGTYENIVEISENRKTPISESFKTFALNYGWNEWEGKYSYSNKRSIFSFGEEKIIECGFVWDHVTADRITSYQKYRMIYGDRRLTILVGKEARDIAEGKNVKVIIPDYGINANFQVGKVEKKNMNTFSLELNSWQAEIYTYVAGSMPNNANSDNLPDYSKTPPSPPTSFSKSSEGAYQSNDGTTLAYVFLQANAPASDNFAKIKFGYRKNGETYYRYVEGNKPASGNTWNARIDGLVPGLYYDYIAISENMFALLSSGNPTLTNQLAPGDTQGPATPTGGAVTGGLQSIIITWSNNSEVDLAGYEVHISTTSGFTPGPSTLKYTGSGTRVEYPASNGVTYYVKIRAFDRLLNYSDYTSQYSGTPDATAPATPTGLSLSTGASVSQEGNTFAWIRATWDANSESDLSHYEYRIKETGGNYSYGTVKTNQTLFMPVKTNVLYYVGIRAIDVAGNASAFTSDSSITTSDDDTVPAAPSGLTITSSFKHNFLDWTNPSDVDLDHIEVWRANTNDRAGASKVAEVSSDAWSDLIGSYNVTRYYWIRAVDWTGNISAWHPSGATAGVPGTTADVNTADYHDLSIVNAKIADLAVDNAKIADLAVNNAKIAALAVTDAKINDLNADKINAGCIRAINLIAALHATKGTYLTSVLLGGESTVNVKDTIDFPSSGSGWIIDTINDRDEFSYTGKTSTTLTGCSGVLAHNNGVTVIPKTKVAIIDRNVNEIRLYGNNGNGVYEEVGSVGITPFGADYIVCDLGSFTNPNSLISIRAKAYSRPAILAESYTGDVEGALFVKNYGTGTQATALRARTEGQDFAVVGDGSVAGKGGWFIGAIASIVLDGHVAEGSQAIAAGATWTPSQDGFYSAVPDGWIGSCQFGIYVNAGWRVANYSTGAFYIKANYTYFKNGDTASHTLYWHRL